MTTDILKRLAFVGILVLLQALVLNHIHLFYCATPLLYVMVPLRFSNAQPRWSALLWSFCTGLFVDIFSNTPGVASGAMTLVGLLQPACLQMFIPKEENEEVIPSIASLGWLKYTAYAAILIIIYCLAFFTLEAFSLFNIILWAESIGGSALLTFLIILAVEKIRD